VADDDWQPTANTGGTTTWSPDLPETWTPPASTENRSDRWDDGPWGAGR
jgi:hypothetical protein